MNSIVSMFRSRVLNNPVLRRINYCGFQVSYAEGDALIGRILHGNAYEPENTAQIVRFIPENEPSIMLDVGANIGLISLACLALRPQLQVYAFEPGPLQNAMFQRTISENDLQDRIELESVALSENRGHRAFRVHAARDVSGDGFIDTERAGRTKSIEVRTETLDAWWESHGRPVVSIVKLDTEGAEYWILRGACKFLRRNSPVLFLEINPRNIKNYPYSIEDLLDELERQSYRLYFIDGTGVTKETISKFFSINDSFMAFPNSLGNLMSRRFD